MTGDEIAKVVVQAAPDLHRAVGTGLFVNFAGELLQR